MNKPTAIQFGIHKFNVSTSDFWRVEEKKERKSRREEKKASECTVYSHISIDFTLSLFICLFICFVG